MVANLQFAFLVQVCSLPWEMANTIPIWHLHCSIAASVSACTVIGGVLWL